MKPKVSMSINQPQNAFRYEEQCVFACRKAQLHICSWFLASKCDIKNKTDISNLRASQIFKDWDEIEKLVVVSIGEPTADRNGMLRMEYIWGWRIVDNDGLAEVSANLG